MSMMPAPSPNGNASTLAELKARTKNLPPDTPLGFFSAGGLDLMQRAANMLAYSTLVPEPYRVFITDKKNSQQKENPNAISNCVLALNMAQRLGADPLMIMQHLYIVDGHPSWSSQFVISAINTCGKFSPLRFKIEDRGEKEAEYEEITRWQQLDNGKSKPIKETRKVKIQNLACTAWAKEKATGEVLEGPTVSMEMAIAEGWYSKTGSKWQTMPEIMLRYRAASFFGKLYAPELLMGLQTAEEVQDKTIVIEAVSPEENNPDNSMTMDDVKEKVEKPKRGRKKSAELPTAETTTIDVAPEPANQPEPEPEQQSGDAEFQNPGGEPEPEQPQPPQANNIDDDNDDDFYANKANAPDETMECPDPLPDGSPRMVNEGICKACAKYRGCPNWT